MRPGVVVYDGFSSSCVFEQLAVRPSTPVYLAINATSGHTTAVAVQVVDACLHILSDYVREGDPGANLRSILVEAQVALGDRLDLVAGPEHWLGYDTVGLRAAASAIPARLRRGGALAAGREEFRALLSRQHKGSPAIRIAASAGTGQNTGTSARWTLNALAAGYAFPVDKRGRLADEPAPGVYRTLMEGLEAFTALMKTSTVSDRVNIRYTEGGQSYVSALPGPAPRSDKSNFLGTAVAPPGSAWAARR
jgi:hypothetical protein